MLTKFSQTTMKKLGFYVYAYYEPGEDTPFYIGKGSGNRVFDHLKAEGRSEKARRIRALRKEGLEPEIKILAHGLDEDTALSIETAAIELVGIEWLTNEKRGTGSGWNGAIEVSRLETRYNPEELCEDDIQDNIILIRINQDYSSGMSAFELYEATRGYWVVNPENAKKADYAIAVYKGLTLEAYQIKDWYPAGSTLMMKERGLKKRELENRHEFVGKIAPEYIRDRYVGKHVEAFFSPGNKNPIKYEGEAFWK